MTASELIAELQALVAEHGDLPVWMDTELGDSPDVDVTVADELVRYGPFNDPPEETLPLRILIY